MSHTPRKIVLASSSAFRRELLSKLGLEFDAESPCIDERPQPGEGPEALALRLSREKARALASRYPKHLIIGSDQVAMLGERQLGKPGTRENAIAQLTAAAGRCVAFYTGVCVLDAEAGKDLSELDRTMVHFRPLSSRQIEAYVDREQPFACAGSFKSEGLGIALFERIEGEDPNALVGLPLIRLARLLETFGCPVL